MKAIGNNLIVQMSKIGVSETKGGLFLAEKQREDIRYAEGTIISVGDNIFDMDDLLINGESFTSAGRSTFNNHTNTCNSSIWLRTEPSNNRLFIPSTIFLKSACNINAPNSLYALLLYTFINIPDNVYAKHCNKHANIGVDNDLLQRFINPSGEFNKAKNESTYPSLLRRN